MCEHGCGFGGSFAAVEHHELAGCGSDDDDVPMLQGETIESSRPTLRGKSLLKDPTFGSVARKLRSMDTKAQMCYYWLRYIVVVFVLSGLVLLITSIHRWLTD